jgi:hypothetical protein
MIPAPSGARVWLAAGQRHQHDIVRPTILDDELDWPPCLREQSRPLRLIQLGPFSGRNCSETNLWTVGG